MFGFPNISGRPFYRPDYLSDFIIPSLWGVSILWWRLANNAFMHLQIKAMLRAICIFAMDTPSLGMPDTREKIAANTTYCHRAFTHDYIFTAHIFVFHDSLRKACWKVIKTRPQLGEFAITLIIAFANVKRHSSRYCAVRCRPKYTANHSRG